MSAAHRPTWEPARAKADVSHISQSFSKHSLPSQTRLKFRRPGDVQRRSVQELKAELEEKERQAAAARNPERAEVEAGGGEAKRRKLLQDAEALDADDPEAEVSKPDDAGAQGYVEQRSVGADGVSGAEDGAKKDEDEEEEEDEDEDEEEEDEDDDTETLLRELEKIKQERAAERERQEMRDHAQEQLTREEEIARGNPLLNLEKAIHGDSAPTSSGTLGAPQKRWDEDLIFRNQAAGSSNLAERGFVNDLTRTEFHKKFMNVCAASGNRRPLTVQRYIK